MEPVTFSLAADGRGREEALRAHFGRFWSTAKGDPFARCCSSQSARHGPDTIDQERKREKGAGGKRDGGELKRLCTPMESRGEWLG